MINRFKEKEPKETIQKVFNIILNELDMPPAIEYSGNKKLNVYSNHVGMEIDNSIFVSGKGTTPLYALASGCGEFMERIQTYMLTLRNFDKPYFLDEFEENNIIMAPYYHYNTKTFKNFEIEKMIKSTNGMAAGNTYEEAAVQAFCEILERDIIYKFLNKQITLNAIIQDENLFEILNIKKFEEYFKAKITFLDVSQTDIPVIMMLAIKENNTYMIQFGSAPTIQIACERCVSEFMQGNNGQDISRFMPLIDFESNPIFDFFFFACNGRMLLSKELLNYFFNLTFNSEKKCKNFNSNNEVLNYILNNKELFGDIYLRDYGFLGFPTVHIVCTKMEDPLAKEELSFEEILNYLNTIYFNYPYNKDLEEYYKKINEGIISFFGKNRNKKNSSSLEEFRNKLISKSKNFNGSKCKDLYKEVF